MGSLAGFRYRYVVKRLKRLGFSFDRQAAGSNGPRPALQALLHIVFQDANDELRHRRLLSDIMMSAGTRAFKPPRFG